MKKLFFALMLAVTSAALSGCPSGYGEPPPLRPIQPPDTDSCEAGCAKLKELGCPEATGSEPADPESCRKDCEYVQNNGLAIRPSCWTGMTSCDQLDTVCK